MTKVLTTFCTLVNKIQGRLAGRIVRWVPCSFGSKRLLRGAREVRNAYRSDHVVAIAFCHLSFPQKFRVALNGRATVFALAYTEEVARDETTPCQNCQQRLAMAAIHSCIVFLVCFVGKLYCLYWSELSRQSKTRLLVETIVVPLVSTAMSPWSPTSLIVVSARQILLSRGIGFSSFGVPSLGTETR